MIEGMAFVYYPHDPQRTIMGFSPYYMGLFPYMGMIGCGCEMQRSVPKLSHSLQIGCIIYQKLCRLVQPL